MTLAAEPAQVLLGERSPESLGTLRPDDVDSKEANVEALRESLQDRRVTTGELARISRVLPSGRLRVILESGVL